MLFLQKPAMCAISTSPIALKLAQRMPVPARMVSGLHYLLQCMHNVHDNSGTCFLMVTVRHCRLMKITLNIAVHCLGVQAFSPAAFLSKCIESSNCSTLAVLSTSIGLCME